MPFVVLVLLYRRVRYGYAFRRIPLTQGKYAIVDPEDYERLNKHKWHVVRGAKTYYAVRNLRIGKKRIAIKIHREIIDPPEPLVVDHINHHGIDNRRANLRPATRAQNAVNKSIAATSSCSSKYRGVSWDKNQQKWHAHLGVKRKRITIGYFKDEIEAAKAYDIAAKKHHGEFAVLNFPDSPQTSSLRQAQGKL